MDICEVAWDALTLLLREGESVCYTAMSIPDGTPLFIEAEAENNAALNIYSSDKLLSSFSLISKENVRRKICNLSAADELTLKLEVTCGSLRLHAVCFGDAKESHYSSFLEIELPAIN